MWANPKGLEKGITDALGEKCSSSMGIILECKKPTPIEQ
jgi:hypothetical protein